MHDDAVGRSLDVMCDEIFVFLVHERLEQILDGKAVGHELDGPKHETRGHDEEEQRVNHQRRGIEHVSGRQKTLVKQNRLPTGPTFYIPVRFDREIMSVNYFSNK